MRVSTTSFTSSFLNQITQLESQQSKLQNEATTGLKVSLPEDNPAVMNQVLNLQTEASANTQYQSNITAASEHRHHRLRRLDQPANHCRRRR